MPNAQGDGLAQIWYVLAGVLRVQQVAPDGRIKRQTSKLARRLGKSMLEDAPARVTTGWAD
jgi:hypothetical protein